MTRKFRIPIAEYGGPSSTKGPRAWLTVSGWAAAVNLDSIAMSNFTVLSRLGFEWIFVHVSERRSTDLTPADNEPYWL